MNIVSGQVLVVKSMRKNTSSGILGCEESLVRAGIHAAGRGRGAYISLTNGLHGRGVGADTRFGRAAGGAGPCFQKACFLLAWPWPAAILSL